MSAWPLRSIASVDRNRYQESVIRRPAIPQSRESPSNRNRQPAFNLQVTGDESQLVVPQQVELVMPGLRRPDVGGNACSSASSTTTAFSVSVAKTASDILGSGASIACSATVQARSRAQLSLAALEEPVLEHPAASGRPAGILLQWGTLTGPVARPGRTGDRSPFGPKLQRHATRQRRNPEYRPIAESGFRSRLKTLSADTGPNPYQVYCGWPGRCRIHARSQPDRSQRVVSRMRSMTSWSSRYTASSLWRR